MTEYTDHHDTHYRDAFDAEALADELDERLDQQWLRNYDVQPDGVVFRHLSNREPDVTITVEDGQVTLREFEGWLESGSTTFRGTTDQVLMRLERVLTLHGITLR